MRRLAEPAAYTFSSADIEPELFRYPGLDPGSFRDAVEQALREAEAP